MSGALIVIDGPAGAGKSTVARRIAEELGAALLDTGAIYRSLAWVARARGVDWDDEAALAPIAAELRIEFRPHEKAGERQTVLVSDGRGDPRDLTEAIRTPAISDGASRVSRHGAVRGRLLDIQRAIAAGSIESGRGCVAEGRDMGTVVFPGAAHKFFLTASRSARARRRHAELLARAATTDDVPSLEQVEVEMAQRDERDSSREAAPLQQADDAVLVDSSELDIDAVVARILAMVDSRAGSP